MKNYCIEKNCIECCIETEMLLSNDDVERIRKLGFDSKFFVAEKNGWLYLKNHDGRCVFHDGVKCLIYDNRPEGCRLYPVIFDMDKKCAVLDNDCPHNDKFRISKIAIKQLFDIISILNYEVAERKKNRK